MSENYSNKKPTQVFKEEIKWLIFILLFVGSIIFNYFTTVKQVGLNTYRITAVETAREKAWEKYDINCKEQTEYLRTIKDDIIKIKTKLEIE